MTVTNLVFMTKKCGLPFVDFTKYFEDVHITLMHRLLGDTLPDGFRRIYIDSSKPPYIGPFRGVDLVLEMVWEGEAGVARFMAKLGEGENAKLLQDSWSNYCDEKGETVVGQVGYLASERAVSYLGTISSSSICLPNLLGLCPPLNSHPPPGGVPLSVRSTLR